MRTLILLIAIGFCSCTTSSNHNHVNYGMIDDGVKIDSILNVKFYFDNDTFICDTIRFNGYSVYIKTIDRNVFLNQISQFDSFNFVP